MLDLLRYMILIMLSQCYIRQDKQRVRLFTFMPRGCFALAKDTFAKVDKGVVESHLVGFFIDGLFHDYLRMKVMRENPKTFPSCIG